MLRLSSKLSMRVVFMEISVINIDGRNFWERAAGEMFFPILDNFSSSSIIENYRIIVIEFKVRFILRLVSICFPSIL